MASNKRRPKDSSDNPSEMQPPPPKSMKRNLKPWVVIVDIGGKGPSIDSSSTAINKLLVDAKVIGRLVGSGQTHRFKLWENTYQFAGTGDRENFEHELKEKMIALNNEIYFDRTSDDIRKVLVHKRVSIYAFTTTALDDAFNKIKEIPSLHSLPVLVKEHEGSMDSSREVSGQPAMPHPLESSPKVTAPDHASTTPTTGGQGRNVQNCPTTCPPIESPSVRAQRSSDKAEPQSSGSSIATYLNNVLNRPGNEFNKTALPPANHHLEDVGEPRVQPRHVLSTTMRGTSRDEASSAPSVLTSQSRYIEEKLDGYSDYLARQGDKMISNKRSTIESYLRYAKCLQSAEDLVTFLSDRDAARRFISNLPCSEDTTATLRAKVDELWCILRFIEREKEVQQDKETIRRLDECMADFRSRIFEFQNKASKVGH